ncbi:hypothetical protein ABPG75_009338 [Micractinium tetrahymenae]
MAAAAPLSSRLARAGAQAALLLALVLLACQALAAPEGGARRLAKHKQGAVADPSGGAATAAAPGAEVSAAGCCAQLPAGFSSTRPVVVISTQGAPLSSIPKPQIETGVKAKIPASVCTCRSPDGQDFGAPIQFSERGSHSEDWDQVRSYSVDLSPSHSFLGMPKGSSWALYGWQNDTGGLHDWFGFELYRWTGNYAPRTQYCELFLTDGLQPLRYPSDDYLGLYLAMEHLGQGKHRVDIKKDSAADSGANSSYILDNEHGKTKQGLVELPPLPFSKIQYMIEYPSKPSQDQQGYILGYLRQFEDVLFGPSFADPAAGWRQLANQTNALDYFLFEELVKSNNNGYRGSQRLTKDAGGPLLFGPPWDTNDGFGQCCGFPVEGYQNGGQSNGTSGGSAISPQGWSFTICEQQERCVQDPMGGVALWYRRMWQDPAFRAAAAQRFAQLRGGVWTDAAIGQAVTSIAATIHDALLRTFQRWPVDLLNPYAPPQPTPGETAGVMQREAQIQATVGKLIQWTTTRLAWMADQFASIALGGAGGSTLQLPPSVVAAGASTATASSAAAPAAVAATGNAPAAAPASGPGNPSPVSSFASGPGTVALLG